MYGYIAKVSHFFTTATRPQGCKNIMLNSLSMKCFLLINVKMPTIVGILTFMSGKNNILGLSKPGENAEYLDIFVLISI